MPYNTRRKSLSLSLLGVRVPVHRNSSNNNNHLPSASAANTERGASIASASSTSASADMPPVAKKIKRSHDDDSARVTDSAEHMKLDTTPPPSPRCERPSVEADAVDATAPKTIDLKSINDEIVEAVVLQLQTTGNRPHLVKELAIVLMQSLRVVQQSANPCAIISSRLSTYLKRNCWSPKTPCPLAKELEAVHPRRTYFYLTTSPHQSLPDASATQMTSRAIVTPPLSSTASISVATDEERRRELSPSPEVDLSSPEFDDNDDDIPMPCTPIGSFSARYGRAENSSRHHRGASPPLEKDEKEFTQTAEGLQKRKFSGTILEDLHLDQTVDADFGPAGDNLFLGEPKSALQPTVAHSTSVASPAIRATTASNMKRECESWPKMDDMLEWDRSPENIELDELDGLLAGY